MRWLHRGRRGISELFRRRRFEREVRDELETFLALDIEAREREGAAPSEARRAARAHFGGVEACKEDLRSRRLGANLDSLAQDVRLSLRMLRRQPTFAAAAILTIALGSFPLAATAGMANWLFFAPAPGVTGADRLVHAQFLVRDDGGDIEPAPLSYSNLADLLRNQKTLSGLAGRTGTSASVAAPGADARLVDVDYVTHDYFDVLGMRLAGGRPFLPEEDREPGGRAVVILGHGLAQTLFGTADGASGRAVLVNGLSFLVVGVTPPDFRGLKNDHHTQMWIPGAAWGFAQHAPRERWYAGREDGLFEEFMGRLAEGVELEQARTELTTAARLLAIAYPAQKHFATTEVVIEHQPGMSFSGGNTREEVSLMISVFAAAGSLVLLLAAANVGNLLLFRGARRRPELAMRAALGASRWRLLRAHLIDVSVLFVVGGALGLALTLVFARMFGGSIIPEAGFLTLPIDWRVAGLVLGGVALMGLLFGGAPAVVASSHGGVALTIRPSGVGGGRRLRNALTVSQLALSLSLLVGAALLLATVRNLVTTDLGFDPAPIVIGRLVPHYNGYDDGRALTFYRELLTRGRAMPALHRVSVSGAAPGAMTGFRERVHSTGDGRDEGIAVAANNVSADYFDVLGLPLRRGRTFTDDEAFARQDGACGPVVVSESLATRLFGTPDAVGRIVVLARARSPLECQVVGVVRDVRSRPDADWEATLYRPLGRGPLFRTVVLARTAGSGNSALTAIRDSVTGIDRAVPLHLPRPLGEQMGFLMSGRRLLSSVLGFLAVLGLLLAAVGLYGLVSETVVDRTREFAVRMAIGASAPDIVRAVLRRSLWLAAFGIAAGITLAVALSAAIRSQLFGVTVLEPWAYLSAAALLAAVVVAASLAPAIRATRLNAVDVLRTD